MAVFGTQALLLHNKIAGKRQLNLENISEIAGKTNLVPVLAIAGKSHAIAGN